MIFATNFVFVNLMKKKKIHLLFGVGEVGGALKKILLSKTTLFWYDINPKIDNNLPEIINHIDVLHITFPQDNNFEKNVIELIKKYKPNLTVIHSTTVPGTTKKFGENAVHSPILGQHDNLYKHIKTFRKAIGPNSEIAKLNSNKYLKNIFDLEFFSSSVATEAAKVLSLLKFALNIEMARYSSDFCKKLRVDFSESYTKFSQVYNDGYEKNNLTKFIHPILDPPKGSIGGSCVVPGVKKAEIVLKSPLVNGILKQKKKN